ncbi:MAG: alpha-galactosidase, partial [Candidatus Acidoferrum typicum]|nr:alpha-galactosidase [Candidatus Acidoferrum typicum]
MKDRTARGSWLKAGAALLLLTSLALFVSLTLPRAAKAQSTTIAATPPMGWNSWNKFGCNVSDKLIREMTDAIVR